ncbi:uncharacterized protein E0L32_005047 [Thyridium curvatum]|uniref:Uncharacterized protein n=1 Tax=Thyridium curvatum TaxID=1093900 RepID=A0A507BDT7_9PEZI|nr:uncharacterized protein E0L32_005047 [Thyridium curvatum]TPX14938.1 hypothetical protein E0L32_005047 [Thyridium curvatum]
MRLGPAQAQDPYRASGPRPNPLFSGGPAELPPTKSAPLSMTSPAWASIPAWAPHTPHSCAWARPRRKTRAAAANAGTGAGLARPRLAAAAGVGADAGSGAGRRTSIVGLGPANMGPADMDPFSSNAGAMIKSSIVGLGPANTDPFSSNAGGMVKSATIQELNPGLQPQQGFGSSWDFRPPRAMIKSSTIQELIPGPQPQQRFGSSWDFPRALSSPRARGGGDHRASEHPVPRPEPPDLWRERGMLALGMLALGVICLGRGQFPTWARRKSRIELVHPDACRFHTDNDPLFNHEHGGRPPRLPASGTQPGTTPSLARTGNSGRDPYRAAGPRPNPLFSGKPLKLLRLSRLLNIGAYSSDNSFEANTSDKSSTMQALLPPPTVAARKPAKKSSPIVLIPNVFREVARSIRAQEQAAEVRWLTSPFKKLSGLYYNQEREVDPSARGRPFDPVRVDNRYDCGHPFEHMISVLKKLPWSQTTMITVAQRHAVMWSAHSGLPLRRTVPSGPSSPGISSKGFISREEMTMLVKNVECPQRSPYARDCPQRPFEHMMSVLVKLVECPQRSPFAKDCPQRPIEEMAILMKHVERPQRPIEEMTMLVKHVDCPQRPFEHMISVLKKLPWNQTAMITVAQRNAPYRSCVGLVCLLQEVYLSQGFTSV